MRERIPSFLFQSPSSDTFRLEGRSLRIPFLEKGLNHLAGMVRTIYSQWDISLREGIFQKTDARIKVFIFPFFLVIVSLRKEISSEILIALFILSLMWFSRLPLLQLYKKILFLSLIFGFLIALPSALNLFNDGEILLPLFDLPRSYLFWIYRVPDRIGLTREGLYGVVILTLRVMNSISLTFLILYTTPFPQIIRALKVFKVPDSLLITLFLSYKYLFIFTKSVEEIHLAKKSRLLREIPSHGARRWIAERIAFLVRRTRGKAEEVFKAMVSRGFSDSIQLPETEKLKSRDWITGVCLLLIGCVLLWI